jgi:hypothetical protein
MGIKTIDTDMLDIGCAQDRPDNFTPFTLLDGWTEVATTQSDLPRRFRIPEYIGAFYEDFR